MKVSRNRFSKRILTVAAVIVACIFLFARKSYSNSSGVSWSADGSVIFTTNPSANEVLVTPVFQSKEDQSPGKPEPILGTPYRIKVGTEPHVGARGRGSSNHLFVISVVDGLEMLELKGVQKAADSSQQDVPVWGSSAVHISTSPRPQSIEFSPDGKMLFVAVSGKIYLCDVDKIIQLKGTKANIQALCESN